MRFVTRIARPRLRGAAIALALVLGVGGCAPGMGTGPMYGATADRTAVISLTFDVDSHRIRPEFYSALDAVAAALTSAELSGYTFEISGHTDRSGRLAYNIALSVLRAQAVTDYLAMRGVPPASMRAQGFGPLMPMDPANPFGAVNRRVEVTSIR